MTAAARETLAFTHEQVPGEDDDETVHTLRAFSGGVEVGMLELIRYDLGAVLNSGPATEDTRTWTRSVGTAETHRRQGVATALYREAERLFGTVRHSEWQTAQGALWSATTHV